jgi:hypothetical protein
VDNSKGIYAGLAGVTLDADERSLGHGIILRRTYAHVMAPFLMAFSPAPLGKPHPAPWSAVKGGFGFDMSVELEIPPWSVNGLSHDQNFLAWWITALLRLRVGPTFIVPIIGEQSFATAKTNNSQATYYPVEMESRQLVLSNDARSEIVELDVAWLEKYWMSAADLFSGNGAFRLLFEATDQCIFSRRQELALLSLWGGLEAIFSPDKVELKYRISSSLASFIEPAGVARMNAQKTISKLYDSRSAVAHGREDKKKDSLQETYSLARRVVLRIIEDNRVPTHVELEAKLFGADLL